MLQPGLAESMCYCEFCKVEQPCSECVQFQPCGHWHCQESVSGYIQVTLSLNISVLRCQTPGCSSEVPHRVVRELCSREMYRRYAELAGKHALVQLVGEENDIL